MTNPETKSIKIDVKLENGFIDASFINGDEVLSIKGEIKSTEDQKRFLSAIKTYFYKSVFDLSINNQLDDFSINGGKTKEEIRLSGLVNPIEFNTGKNSEK